MNYYLMANDKGVRAENIKKYRQKKVITRIKPSKIAGIIYNTIIKIGVRRYHQPLN